MRQEARTTCLLAAATLCAGVLAGCSDGGGNPSPSTSSGPSHSRSPSASQSGSPGSATGKVTSSSAHLDRTFLVDGRGRTLYLFEADSSGTSTCAGSCAQAWPPMTVANIPKAGGDVQQDLLGTTTRNNGDKQVTYHGHPVYYYKGDTTSGQTKGQGLNQFGAKWFVVTPGGAALKVKSSASPSSSSGGNGY